MYQVGAVTPQPHDPRNSYEVVLVGDGPDAGHQLVLDMVGTGADAWDVYLPWHVEPAVQVRARTPRDAALAAASDW